MRGVTAALAARSVCSVRGRDERQRLGVVLDLAADRDQDGLVVADQRHDVVARDVGRGHEHDLRPVEALVALEPEQAGMGVARTDRGPVPRPGEDEVVGVLRLAGQLGGPFAAERAAAARTAGHDRIRREPRAGPGLRGVPWTRGGQPPWRERVPPEDGRDGPESRVRTVPVGTPPDPAARCRGSPERSPIAAGKGPLRAGDPYSPAATIPGSAFILESFGPWINRPSRIC